MQGFHLAVEVFEVAGEELAVRTEEQGEDAVGAEDCDSPEVFESQEIAGVLGCWPPVRKLPIRDREVVSGHQC